MNNSPKFRLLSTALALVGLGALLTFPLGNAFGAPRNAPGPTAPSAPRPPTPPRMGNKNDAPAASNAPAQRPAPPAQANASADFEAPPAPAGPRRGENPCNTADPGFGLYDPWQNVYSGHMIAPKHGGITRTCQFDLVVHFHGHEAVRKEFVKTAKGPVLVGLDLGIGSGAYESGFADPQRFERMLDGIEGAIAKKYSKPKCSVRKLAISSWSAGYGAVYRILTQPAGRKVDSVILLDSLHAGYANEQTHSLKTEQLEPFVAFAKQAAANRKFMFLSHSSIIPPGYASTTEVARHLVAQVGGRERRTRRQDVLGLDLFAAFDRGHFHVRGYGGNDKPDHCAHLGLMGSIVKNYLQPRWRTPRATAR